MLLRPSNTLLLDEPTNHLDLDSKDVLLEALEDYGGTLIIVSHDRYFVERLATKIIEIGHGEAVIYPGSYSEYLWSKAQKDTAEPARNPETRPTKPAPPRSEQRPHAPSAPKSQVAERAARKQQDADRKKHQRAAESLRKRIADLESRIAQREAEVKELEAAMAAPGFYDDLEGAKPVTGRHQALMWEVGDLMAQWEALQEHAAQQTSET
jgi:ATP-binding cassette subfamily F protein 3